MGKKLTFVTPACRGIYLPARFGRGKRGGALSHSEARRRAGPERARGARYPNDVIGLALLVINMTMWLLNGTLVRTYGPPIGCVFRLNACHPDAYLR